jgi:long-subunit fatty acid transport protein
VDATAFFLAGNLGVMLQPAPWLTIGLHAHLTDGPIVFRGNATATARPYAADPAQRHRSTFETEVTLPMPNLYRVGVRFASLRDTASTQWSARDPMRDEHFDVEVDLHYENSSVLQQVVTRNRGIVETEPGMGAPATPEVALRRGWRDTWGVRVGADYNVIADVFALRAGVSWDLGAQTGPRELNGREVAWNPDAGVDGTGYDTVGLSAGASLRWRWLTVDLAYQHLFVSGQDVLQGRGTTVSGVVPIAAADCARGPGYPGPGACTNNQGTYTASYDVFSLGITGRH